MDVFKNEQNDLDCSMHGLHAKADKSDITVETEQAKKHESEMGMNALMDKLEKVGNVLHEMLTKQDEIDMLHHKNIITGHKEDDRILHFTDLKHGECEHFHTVAVVERETKEQKETETVFIKQEVVDKVFEAEQAKETSKNVNSDADDDILYKPVTVCPTDVKVEVKDVEIKAEPNLEEVKFTPLTYTDANLSDSILLNGMDNTRSMVNLTATNYSECLKENNNVTLYGGSESFEITGAVSSGISLIKTEETIETKEVVNAIEETGLWLKPNKEKIRKRTFSFSNAELDTCENDLKIQTTDNIKRRRVDRSDQLPSVESISESSSLTTQNCETRANCKASFDKMTKEPPFRINLKTISDKNISISDDANVHVIHVKPSATSCQRQNVKPVSSSGVKCKSRVTVDINSTLETSRHIPEEGDIVSSPDIIDIGTELSRPMPSKYACATGKKNPAKLVVLRRIPFSNAGLAIGENDPKMQASDRIKHRSVDQSSQVCSVENELKSGSLRLLTQSGSKAAKCSARYDEMAEGSPKKIISIGKKFQNIHVEYLNKIKCSVARRSIPLVTSQEKGKHLTTIDVTESKETRPKEVESAKAGTKKNRSEIIEITASNTSGSGTVGSAKVRTRTSNVHPLIYIDRPKSSIISKPSDIDGTKRSWLFSISVPNRSNQSFERSNFAFMEANSRSGCSQKSTKSTLMSTSGSYQQEVATTVCSKHEVTVVSPSDEKRESSVCFSSPGCSVQNDEKTVNLAPKSEKAYTVTHSVQHNMASTSQIQEQSESSKGEGVCDRVLDIDVSKAKLRHCQKDKETDLETADTRNLIEFLKANACNLPLDKLYSETNEMARNQVLNLLAEVFESRIFGKTSTDGSFKVKLSRIMNKVKESYEKVIVRDIAKSLGTFEKAQQNVHTWLKRTFIEREMLNQLQPEIVTGVYKQIQAALQINSFKMGLGGVPYEVKNMGRSFSKFDDEFEYTWLVTSNPHLKPARIMTSNHTQTIQFNFPKFPLVCGQPDFEQFNQDCTEFMQICGSKISVNMQSCQGMEFLTRDNINTNTVNLLLSKRVLASRFGCLLKAANIAGMTVEGNIKVRLPQAYVRNVLKPHYSQKWQQQQNLMKTQAISLYLQQKDKEGQVVHVGSCGVVINPAFPHLAAMPDRKVFLEGKGNGLGIILVHCPEKLNSIFDSAKSEDFCLSLNDARKLCLNRHHDCFFEIQGSLAITGVKWCDFLVYTQAELHVERVNFDEKTWKEVMFPKCSKFYVDHAFCHLQNFS